jgi:predicted Zn-ribbon and HTH transcriptional regulator
VCVRRNTGDTQIKKTWVRKSSIKHLKQSGGNMALELVKCRHCGFEFRTDVEALIEEGEVRNQNA